MKTSSGDRFFPYRFLTVLGLLSMGMGLFVWLRPAESNQTDPIEVTDGATVTMYRSLTQAMADAPSWVGSLLEIASEGVLVVLGLLLVWMWWIAFRSNDIRRAVMVILVFLATFCAYILSEILKLVINEARPCRVLTNVSPVAECPVVGDWSFPSNHATLAVALAVGAAVTRPYLTFIVLPLAFLAALLRVALGVHYPHDVFAGAVLGATIVAVMLVAATPFAQRLASTLVKRWRSVGVR